MRLKEGQKAVALPGGGPALQSSEEAPARAAAARAWSSSVTSRAEAGFAVVASGADDAASPEAASSPSAVLTCGSWGTSAAD